MEINKCLEDPNTQYSDQYMPLAMMPAVVEAIQNAGGGGGVIFTTSTLNSQTQELVLDKTWAELYSACLNNTGLPVVILNENTNENVRLWAGTLTTIYTETDDVSTTYYVEFGNEWYAADSENAYPKRPTNQT